MPSSPTKTSPCSAGRMVPASMLIYISAFMLATLYPLDCKILEKVRKIVIKQIEPEERRHLAPEPEGAGEKQCHRNDSCYDSVYGSLDHKGPLHNNLRSPYQAHHADLLARYENSQANGVKHNDDRDADQDESD